MNRAKKVLLLLLLSVFTFSGVGNVAIGYNQEDVITPELQTLFAGFDSNHDHNLDWTEGMNFYNWVESQIDYRYDDEDDPDGKLELSMGHIIVEQLGDGRSGGEYWQLPSETYAEKYGDCEDMAILELAFYTYFNISSYVGVVDVDGDEVTDHAICIVAFSEEAFQQIVQSQGITEYYDLDGTKFVIVDNAYSSAYGFVGYYDPITGLPVPYEEVDFTLYEVKTLEEMYSEWWEQSIGTTTLDPTLLVVVVVIALVALLVVSYIIVTRRRAAEEESAVQIENGEMIDSKLLRGD